MGLFLGKGDWTVQKIGEIMHKHRLMGLPTFLVSRGQEDLAGD